MALENQPNPQSKFDEEYQRLRVLLRELAMKAAAAGVPPPTLPEPKYLAPMPAAPPVRTAIPPSPFLEAYLRYLFGGR